MGDVAHLTLSDHRQVATPSGMRAGHTLVMLVRQGEGGSNTLTWSNRFKWPSGQSPILSEAEGDVDIITFVTDGVYMYGVARQLISGSEASEGA